MQIHETEIKYYKFRKKKSEQLLSEDTNKILGILNSEKVTFLREKLLGNF